ncbi:MAG TPA: M1 family aminopeptidase [Rhodanobacteraceae bacterium]
MNKALRMFGAIFGFELRQQLRQPVTWLIWVAFVALAILQMTGPGVHLLGVHEGVARNAPLVIANAVSMFCVLATLAAGAFSSAAALRDFDCRMAPIVFSLPLGRRTYIAARFAAAWVLVLATLAAATVGIAIGNALPGVGPADAAGAMAYPWAFVVLALPGTLFITALLFGLALATRSLLATFVGVACLLVLLFAGHVFMQNAGSVALAASVDPFGYHTLQAVTQYWSSAELNANLPRLAGWLLFNRVLWSGLAVVLLGVLLAARWNLLGVRRGAMVEHRAADATRHTLMRRPRVNLQTGGAAGWIQCWHWLALDTARTLRGTPFLALLLFAIVSVALNVGAQRTVLGMTALPVTADVIGLVQSSLGGLLAITLVFYAGELVWRDRDLRVAEVRDTMPWPNAAAVAAKAGVLVAVVVAFLVCGALVGIGWQLMHGYTHIQPLLYGQQLALAAIPFVLLAWLCLALQVACGQRFVGYVFSVAWWVIVAFALPLFGWDDHLFWYGTTSHWLYSAMNGYGSFLPAVLWFDVYWLLFALALLVVTSWWWLRGSDTSPWRRVRTAGAHAHAGWRFGAAALLLAFVGCGAWIFHNTHVLNQVHDGYLVAAQQAQYEKAYAHYGDFPQPRIADEQLDVALYPRARTLDIRGRYVLVNRGTAPIDILLVQYPAHFKVESIALPAHSVVSRDPAPHFVVYHLAAPLAAGASMTFGFHLLRTVRGFANEPSATYLVHNGSFFDNTVNSDGAARNVLPHIGYQPYLELTNAAARRRFGLPPHVSPMGSPDDPAALALNAAANDSDWVRADVTLSTAAERTALTAGVLQKSWIVGKRRYFHYVTEAPLPNELPFVSARYAVRRATWNGIGIAVYYDASEAWNVDRILRTVRDALAFYSTRFGPYPYRQLRVAIVPYNYAFAAEAWPGLVVVRETGPVGPEAQPAPAGAVDPAYMVLTHEVSHEWWDVQENPANVRGLNLITESFAQYSALMVMKQRYGAEALRPVLRYLLDAYLQARRRASVPESPLADVGGNAQSYIYYDKGALAFYTLQDYLGEAMVNRALRAFLAATRFKGPPYPTSKQFLAILRATAGPQAEPLIDDLFRTITAFDDRMLSARAQPLGDGKYRVTLHVHAAMYRADGAGAETRAKLNIPLEIGVFVKPARGGGLGKPLYLAKYPVKDGDSTIVVTVDGKPYTAGIDPYNELIDANPSDNLLRVAIH